MNPTNSNDAKKFRIRRAPGKTKVLGYRCLFTDSGADGYLARAMFLMQDNSLVIVSYNNGGNTLNAYASARAYLNARRSELEAAGRFDAIGLLANELNSTN